ncbi:hypothetical protein As57867_001984, partial [Aphanomyces stellatus]
MGMNSNCELETAAQTREPCKDTIKPDMKIPFTDQPKQSIPRFVPAHDQCGHFHITFSTTMSTLSGIFAALLAYTIWGLSPLYWRMLLDVPSDQLVCHRIVWSCVLIAILLMYTCRWHNFKAYSVTWDNVSLHATSALFIGTNWTLFVWAANAGYIVQTSLGGYILPLVTVLLGVVVLGEKLRPLQWVAIGIAALGVLIVSIGYGVVPWISFALATTEGIYSLLKKKATLGPLDGVMIETGALFLPSLG